MIAMSDDNNLYTVGEVAERFSVTVRTLHHWEAQGLLARGGRGQEGDRGSQHRVSRKAETPPCRSRTGFHSP